MSRFRARWILPIADEPIENGYVDIEDGRVRAVGSGPLDDCVDLGDVALMPALVNAHTHLELSYLHGRIPPSPSFGEWVRAVMEARLEYPDAADPRILEPARSAILRAQALGTGLVGDVSNTLVTAPLLREANMPAHVFHELTGFTEQDPEGRVRDARVKADAAAGSDVRISVAPHAPYSVAAALFGAIRADLELHPMALSSVHLGENPEELQLLRDGTGPIRELLESLGRWPAEWTAPGVSPVAYLSDLGFLDARVLVVHGVQFDGEDLSRLSGLGATLVACPRSNVYVGVGSPPLEAFYAMDVDVAFGTDSLASVADLDMLSELAEARRIAPRVPAARLLESATLIGARGLGFGRELGSIERGKRAALITVPIPADTIDVEEYLVSGVDSSGIGWLP